MNTMNCLESPQKIERLKKKLRSINKQIKKLLTEQRSLEKEIYTIRKDIKAWGNEAEKLVSNYEISRSADEIVYRFEKDIVVRAYANGDLRKAELVLGEEWINPKNNGFLKNSITVSIKGRNYTTTKKRFLAISFIGVPETKEMVARSIDGNAKNDLVSNLEWIPKDDYKLLQSIDIRLRKHRIKIYRPILAEDIRKFRERGLSLEKLRNVDVDRVILNDIAKYINNEFLGGGYNNG